MIEQSPLLLLTLARLRLFLREPSTIFWSFVFPILLSLALGIAFRNRPPEPALVGVSEGTGADAIATQLERAPGLRVLRVPSDEARAALRSGKIAVLVIPGTGASTAGAAVRIYEYDPSRPESRLARALADDVLQRAAGRRDPSPVADRHVVEPGARYIDFLIPGILGLNIMSSGMWGVGYVIVETRMRKLLKRMVATPMRRRDFLLSFVLMRLVFLAMELPVMLLFGYFAFGVPLRGSIALLTAVSLVGAFAFTGIGLLVASRAQNTSTVSGLINLVMMPMFLLSGVFFSSDNFPPLMQPFIQALPLTALNDALRAIMLEGAGVATVAADTALLAVISVASFTAALKLFKWT